MTTATPGNARALLHRFRSGLIWNVIAAVFNQGSTFVVGIVAANVLGRAAFGQYAMILSTIGTVGMVAQLATGSTTTRYVADFRGTEKDRAGRVIGLCGVLAASSAAIATALVVVSAHVVALALRHPALEPLLQLAAASILFSVANGFATGALAGLEEYRLIARVGAAAGSSYFCLCTAGAFFRGIDGAVVGMVIANGLQSALLLLALRSASRRHGITIAVRDGLKERRIVLRFLVPAALVGLTTMPAQWFANASLARLVGMADVALYTASASLRTLVMFVPTLANLVGTSMLNHHRGLGDAQSYRRTFRTNLAVAMALVLLVAPGVAVLAPQLLAVFGRDFSDGGTALRILMAATIAEALFTCLYQAVVSLGRMWLSLFALALPRDVAFAVLAYCLAPTQGAAGVALAHAFASALALVLMLILLGSLGTGAPIPRESENA